MTIKLTPRDDNLDNLPFEQWARAKYAEIAREINPCDANGNLDPQRLNQVLMKFAQHFAWAITIQEVESNKLHIQQHQYDNWHKECYNVAFRGLREDAAGAGRAPSQVTVEARVVQLFGEEKATRQTSLENLSSRVDVLKGFEMVLERQASILQTLSSNMRSELFFAGGIPISGTRTDEQKRAAAKATLHAAMRGQSQPAEGIESQELT